jgi:hypothetical protein
VSALVAGGLCAAGAAVTGGLALAARNQALSTDKQRPANEARDRFVAYRAASLATGAAAVVSAAAAWWLWPSQPRTVVGLTLQSRDVALVVSRTW